MSASTIWTYVQSKPSRRRNPQKDWGDLEFLLCQALRHRSSRSALGWHDLRGRLGSNGWVSVKEAAEAMQVSEEKTRVELDGSGDYVRALQGHTPDSGLSKEDFHTEELTLRTGELWTDSGFWACSPKISEKHVCIPKIVAKHVFNLPFNPDYLQILDTIKVGL